MKSLILSVLMYALLVWGERNTPVASTALLGHVFAYIVFFVCKKKYGKDKLVKMAEQLHPAIIMLSIVILASQVTLGICCVIWLIQTMSV